jgi:glycosyltransferase involved in cell wall biosynthesis
MRVIVLHNMVRGGAHRRLAEQTRRLPFEVREVCFSSSVPVTSNPVVVEFEERAMSLPRPTRTAWRYDDLRRLRRAWERVARRVESLRPDAVFANPCRLVQAPHALVSLSVPSVYFCDETRRVEYELAARTHRNPWTAPLYAPLNRCLSAMDRSAVQRATVLATNSAYTQGEIGAAYGRSATVVRLGVADAFLSSDLASAPSGSFVLTVGNLMPTKGHELVIRAAALSGRRWPVVIMSPRTGDEEQARLSGIARQLSVPLTFRIDISDEEVALTYAAARATAYMAQREPLGLASLEAQACGCPVVVAAEGGLPETVDHGKTGWAVPRDPAAIAAKLDLLDDEPLRRTMAAAATAHGSSFSWQRSSEEIARMLATVTETKSA